MDRSLVSKRKIVPAYRSPFSGSEGYAGLGVKRDRSGTALLPPPYSRQFPSSTASSPSTSLDQPRKSLPLATPADRSAAHRAMTTPASGSRTPGRKVTPSGLTIATGTTAPSKKDDLADIFLDLGAGSSSTISGDTVARPAYLNSRSAAPHRSLLPRRPALHALERSHTTSTYHQAEAAPAPARLPVSYRLGDDLMGNEDIWVRPLEAYQDKREAEAARMARLGKAKVANPRHPSVAPAGPTTHARASAAAEGPKGGKEQRRGAYPTPEPSPPLLAPPLSFPAVPVNGLASGSAVTPAPLLPPPPARPPPAAVPRGPPISTPALGPVPLAKRALRSQTVAFSAVLAPPAASPARYPARPTQIATSVKLTLATAPVPAPARAPTAAQSAKCESRYVAGKGIGVFLSRAVKRGETIIAEQPFFHLLSADIDAEEDGRLLPAWRALGPEERILVLSFMAKRTDHDVVGLRNGKDTAMNDLIHDIVVHNGIPLATDPNAPPRTQGMFEMIGRVNHSCSPNSVWRWDERKGLLYLVVYKDLPAGAEVTAAYSDDLCQPQAVRRQALQDAFGFECGCERCSAPKAEIIASDARIARFRSLQRRFDIDSHTPAYEHWLSDRHSAAKVLKEAIRILEVEGKYSEMGDVLEELHILYICYGMRSEAIAAGRRVRAHYAIVQGEDKGKEWDAQVERPEISENWREAITFSGSASEEDGEDRLKRRKSRRRW